MSTNSHSALEPELSGRSQLDEPVGSPYHRFIPGSPSLWHSNTCDCQCLVNPIGQVSLIPYKSDPLIPMALVVSPSDFVEYQLNALKLRRHGQISRHKTLKSPDVANCLNYLWIVIIHEAANIFGEVSINQGLPHIGGKPHHVCNVVIA